MRHGSRVLGALSGAVAGLGLAVLLQQFAVVPLTTAVLVGLPVGLAFVGAGAGWPRGGSPTEASAPPESHPGRPDAPPPGGGRPSAAPPSEHTPATDGPDSAPPSGAGGPF